MMIVIIKKNPTTDRLITFELKLQNKAQTQETCHRPEARNSKSIQRGFKNVNAE